MKTYLPLKIAAVLLTLCFSGCAEFNDPYYTGSSGRYDPYYNNGRYDRDDYYYDRQTDRARDARRDLERERDRLENERERLEHERHQQQNRPVYNPPPQRVQERCPSGFSPSEQKCSPQERKRGCRDMRLPGGLGCVSR